MVLIETAIVMVGLCVVAYVLSKADIKITIIKKDEALGWQPKEVIVTKGKPDGIEKLQEQLDEDRDKQKQPTLDDVVREVQSILGGGSDE